MDLSVKQLLVEFCEGRMEAEPFLSSVAHSLGALMFVVEAAQYSAGNDNILRLNAAKILAGVEKFQKEHTAA